MVCIICDSCVTLTACQKCNQTVCLQCIFKLDDSNVCPHCKNTPYVINYDNEQIQVSKNDISDVSDTESLHSEQNTETAVVLLTCERCGKYCMQGECHTFIFGADFPTPVLCMPCFIKTQTFLNKRVCDYDRTFKLRKLNFIYFAGKATGCNELNDIDDLLYLDDRIMIKNLDIYILSNN